ncbi:dTDP-4-dehydrorhamnose reductase [Saccharothrix texasensis]|uniref:dTDP-4-dehydrorhamnose reductase n=1 Tax=Saccharothrix texasensis TaxID=103734 RepID=A0A3N1HCC1_9PSEU|nr:dTDP-4-dehydrorhamnose reductase [Saccharothrix texasensis]ROP40148.1 dTDP-4-dehydrorhamnose reductase [Saccharothrix texasensis]
MALALLVPGGRGQLGQDVVAAAPDDGLVHAPSSAELDLTDASAVADAVAVFAASARDTGFRPVVVNTAAYTAVDAAETDADRAAEVNATGPEHLAASCRDHNVPLIHVSTDYVFPGDGTRPYEPTDETAPKSVYGRTKLDGEQRVLSTWDRSWVVRTAWVYGEHGNNFVKTMARLAGANDTLSVVDDQVGSPTWSLDLAHGLLELATTVSGGGTPARVLHATGGGETTWCGFARAIFTELGLDPTRVHPCTTADFPRPAPRPAYSVLSNKAWTDAGLTPLRHWQEALTTAIKTNALP